MKLTKTHCTVCFLLLPRVHLMDLSGAAQVFYEADNINSGAYTIRYCGVQTTERTEQGLSLSGLQPLDDVQLQAGDFVFVPGMDFASFCKGQLDSAIASVRQRLQDLIARQVNVASVCSGTLILAEAGILDGKRCTSHWKCIDYIKQHYPSVSVVSDCLYANDGLVYTSAGMTSGIDMALSIVEQHHGPILAAKVAREMVVYLRRDESNAQETIFLDYRTHFNAAVHKVQDLIISHPHENFTLDQLAEIANTSTRTLTRFFKKATGHTIVQFKTAMRLEMARTLSRNSDYTTEKIASLCGFESARQLRRIQHRHQLNGHT